MFTIIRVLFFMGFALVFQQAALSVWGDSSSTLWFATVGGALAGLAMWFVGFWEGKEL